MNAAMRDLAAVAFSLALPWLAGALAVLALQRRADDPKWLLSAGYGYLLGAFTATLILRAFSAAGLHWALPAIAATMLALIIGLGWPTRTLLAPSSLRRSLALAARRFAAVPASGRALFWGCLALVAIRVASLALEVAWRPLLPWDAWSQWGTKARVWTEFGWIVPFVSQQEWLTPGDPMRFVDMHPGYPATVPLLQVWTNLWLGRWDESLMNAPWIALLVSLALAFHAQLRRAGASTPRAMVFTYLLVSLPFLDIHVALAGIADIFIGASYGMAAIALWQWARMRERSDLVLAVSMAIVCASIKVEGMLWALTLLPGALVTLHRRSGLALVAALAMASLAYLAFGPAELKLFGYVLRTSLTNVTLPLAQHLFVMDNWHLLWYATLAIVALRHRQLLRPALAPMTTTMLGAFGLVFVVYFMSTGAGGVDDESLVNRMPLHLTPALVFYLALLLQEAPPARTTRSASQLQANATDA